MDVPQIGYRGSFLEPARDSGSVSRERANVVSEVRVREPVLNAFLLKVAYGSNTIKLLILMHSVTHWIKDRLHATI